MNPVSGGSPPMDSRVSMVKVVITGVVFHVWDKSSVVVVVFWMSSMNIVKVIII